MISTRIALYRWLCASVFIALLLIVDPIQGSLDARFSYSVNDALQFLDNLSPKGRTHYVFHELLDLLFIVSYTMSFLGIAHQLFKHPIPVWVAGFCFLPGFADLMETVSIIGATTTYPSVALPVLRFAHVMTPTKWILLVFPLFTFVLQTLLRSFLQDEH